MRSVSKAAAGVASLPSVADAFATTQAAWRFLNNERVKLDVLVEPLRKLGRRRVRQSSAPFALLVHDWSKLSYRDLQRKRDWVQLTHSDDVGYELSTALLVSADDGSPLAPMEMHMKTADGMLSTRDPAPPVMEHQEQVLPTMQASRTWRMGRPLVHVIDREGDSVDHYRQWEAAGELFLVRADDRRVKWDGESWLLSEIAKELRKSKAFIHCGTATFRNQPAQLWIAQTEVVLYRPAKKNIGGRRFERAGKPVLLRLIVVELRSDGGKTLANWLLLSNVPTSLADAHRLGLCYYWRWQIESYFKLLKSHGQQLEEWQQETGAALSRRLLIASMACALVWQLQADTSAPAQELKTLLIRMSGRQMKRARPHTAPALLAGLGTLLTMLCVTEMYEIPQLKRLAKQVLTLNSS